MVFFCGECEVIQALDLVAAVMRDGETAEVMADPEFAYGKDKMALMFPCFVRD